MSRKKIVEPDFAAESEKFQSDAAEKGMQLDTLRGGFYVSDETQQAWAKWIRVAAKRGFQ